MKKHILLVILTVFAINTFAQEETEKVKDKPVSPPFENGILIDNQTTYIPDARTLEYVIQHKFGSMENGMSDLFGIYSPGANIRLGINYIPLKNFQIGIGATKKNMYTDFNAKWTILEQTEQNSVPVAVALYAVAAIDGRNADEFGSGKVVDSKQPYPLKYVGLGEDYAFVDRLSYFSQLIIGRKFTDWLTLQTAISYSRYNTVEWDQNHQGMGLHVNGRIKISPQGSIVFNYDHPLQLDGFQEQRNWDTHPNSNLSFGFEISTSTHAFQIYMGTADGIIPQDMMMYNQNDWQDKGLAIGMTITRLWMF